MAPPDPSIKEGAPGSSLEVAYPSAGPDGGSPRAPGLVLRV